MSKDQHMLVNLSGRGDKDMNTVAERCPGRVLLPAVLPRAGESRAAECEEQPVEVIRTAGGPLNEPHRRHVRPLAAARPQALIPYVTAGDPYADVTPPIMHALAAAAPT
jgi:hypothetical protein